MTRFWVCVAGAGFFLAFLVFHSRFCASRVSWIVRKWLSGVWIALWGDGLGMEVALVLLLVHLRTCTGGRTAGALPVSQRLNVCNMVHRHFPYFLFFPSSRYLFTLLLKFPGDLRKPFTGWMWIGLSIQNTLLEQHFVLQLTPSTDWFTQPK